MTILNKIDEMKAILTAGEKYNHKKRKYVKIKKRNYKRAINRMHKKLLHFQQELHYKTCIYLCENYKRIMVTNFSSKQVSSKKKNLNVESKRVLQKVSHYAFRQRLQQKCEEYGCQYIERTEEFTTQTCSKCGYIKKDIGSNKIYTF